MNGNLEIKVRTSGLEPNDDEKDYGTKIVITPNGQLISYEAQSDDFKTTFKLEDYVFDSPDFTMEDTQAAYDRIERIEKEENEKWRSAQ